MTDPNDRSVEERVATLLDGDRLTPEQRRRLLDSLSGSRGDYKVLAGAAELLRQIEGENGAATNYGNEG
ncbi:hypothetical protein [Longimicrobium sp.]|jgi:hypothetical protein|uniref:hypothetical protein n=1 Tax=Longimicrobium sp. TaxID=2029185 RepID=UPI002F9350C0